MNVPPVISRHAHRPSPVPLWLAVAANGTVFLLSIPFYQVPAGAQIRPMGWAFWMFGIAVGALSLIPVVILELWWSDIRGRSWVVALLLALTPLPLSELMLHHAMWLRGFELSP